MQVNKIWDSLHFDLIKLLAPEKYLYAGHPNYHWFFGRDSSISALQTLPFLPEIAKATLYMQAKYQAKGYDKLSEAEPGKCAHEHRLSQEKIAQLPNLKFPYYGSVDSTSWFLILLKEYIQITHDIHLLYDLWENAALAVRWHLDNANSNPFGFITYERKTDYGLFHQGWKDSFEDHLKIEPPVAIVEEQGYAYLALKSYCSLQNNLAIKLPYLNEARNLAERIKQNFVQKFWMPEERFFALALDGKGNQRKAITSNPGHLLMCGDFLEEKYAWAIVNRLFQKDMWTIGGIRSHSEKEPDFDPFSYHLGSIWPHDNWIIWKGMLNWSFKKRAWKIKSALFRAYRTLGHIPECYAVVTKFTVGPFRYQCILKIKKIIQLERHNKIMGTHLEDVAANPLQAWSIGALLSMLFYYHYKEVK